MPEEKQYAEFRKQLTPGWWLSNRRYTAYMVRELTSFFVAAYALLYIYQLSQLASGAVSYNRFLDLLRSPGMVIFSMVALSFTLYHSLTWFYLMGRVLPLKIGGKTTTPWQALAANSIILLIISYAVITLFVLR